MTTFTKTKGRTALVSVILEAVLIFSGIFALTVHAQDIRNFSYYGGQYNLTQDATDPDVNIDSVYAKTAENGILVRLHGSSDKNIGIYLADYDNTKQDDITWNWYGIEKSVMSYYGYHNVLIPYRDAASNMKIKVYAFEDNGDKGTKLFSTYHIKYNGRTDYLSYDSCSNDYAPLIKKAKSLTRKKKSTTSKILAIHKYIARTFYYDDNKAAHMKYDTPWENITHEQKASTTWKTKKGVCGDFAIVETAMLRSIGIKSYVTGSTNHS